MKKIVRDSETHVIPTNIIINFSMQQQFNNNCVHTLYSYQARMMRSTQAVEIKLPGTPIVNCLMDITDCFRPMSSAEILQMA